MMTGYGISMCAMNHLQHRVESVTKKESYFKTMHTGKENDSQTFPFCYNIEIYNYFVTGSVQESVSPLELI
jgi:hypothetical protein